MRGRTIREEYRNAGQEDPGTTQITFLPDNVTVQAHAGDTILDVALSHGIDLAHDCGGNCACTTCHVVVMAGGDNLSRMEEAENDRLDTADARTPTSRLGCQAILTGGSVTLYLIPPEAF